MSDIAQTSERVALSLRRVIRRGAEGFGQIRLWRGLFLQDGLAVGDYINVTDSTANREHLRIARVTVTMPDGNVWEDPSRRGDFVFTTQGDHTFSVWAGNEPDPRSITLEVETGKALRAGTVKEIGSTQWQCESDQHRWYIFKHGGPDNGHLCVGDPIQVIVTRTNGGLVIPLEEIVVTTPDGVEHENVFKDGRFTPENDGEHLLVRAIQGLHKGRWERIMLNVLPILHNPSWRLAS